jgi:hypothetical protein
VFHASYEEWLKSFDRTVSSLRQLGGDAVKVVVDVEELLAWCRERGVPITGGSRSQFVLEKTQRGEYVREESAPAEP